MSAPSETARDLILTPPQIPTTVVVSSAVITAVDMVEQRMGEAPAITDQPSMDAVRAVMNEAQRTWRSIETQRETAKRFWLDVCRLIDTTARPFLDRCLAVKNECKEQMEAFLVLQDALKAEAARALAVAQAAAAASVGPGVAPKLTVTAYATDVQAPVGRWQELELFDATLLPREFMVPDWAKIRSHMEVNGDGSVAGVRYKQVVRVVAR
jgi:hypothetical protein